MTTNISTGNAYERIVRGNKSQVLHSLFRRTSAKCYEETQKES